MKQIVSSDTKLVNGLAVAAIALVLFLTFKSLLLPLLLLFIIEAAIWINLSVPYFAGNSLVYIGFLVINTVQLGATIDYAIFITNNYLGRRKTMGKMEAIIEVLNRNLIAIMTSALILGIGRLLSEADVLRIGLLLVMLLLQREPTFFSTGDGCGDTAEDLSLIQGNLMIYHAAFYREVKR